jgi:8-oxo-dGTP pyrophosphatase MutT (NUDIX family)
VTFAETVARLEAALQAELPGAAGQGRMAPVPRRNWPKGFNEARIRHAAALLLVFPGTDQATDPLQAPACIVLTVRGETPRHPGQISLPGGVVEPGETFVQGALREAHEEVALDRHGVRILGALTPLDIPVSGFRLFPIVAARAVRPQLTPADGEVAHILEVAIDALLDPGAVRRVDREREGVRLTIPGFHVAAHEIWGATAMVLAEFLTLLGWTGPGAS